MIIRVKHNTTTLELELSTWKELHKWVISHTDQYTKRLSCINLHDHTHHGVINMERATQDGYITHRSIHELCIKIIMISITQPFWRWSYQYGKSFARWLHHTPINTRKYHHASTLMIIRIKHNPTILVFELWAWQELHKMVISHTDPYTKRLSCINFHDHTHQE